MWPTLPPSLKTLCLSVLVLWVITFPVGYHWQWVRGHCACAESRDPWVGGQKQLHFWNPRHRYACSVCNFGGCIMKIIKVICDNNARPCVKRCISFCACAKSRDLLKWSKWLIAVVLVDVDLPYWTSKVKHIVAFTAIFSNICIAHAQKWLFMNFRCKFRHRRSIRRPRFPIKVQNFRDLATFSVDICILYAECPPHFYFRFVWPTYIESIPHALNTTSIIPTKFEVDMTIHCRVIAFLSADTSRNFVTFPFDLLTLNSCSACRVTWPTLPPS